MRSLELLFVKFKQTIECSCNGALDKIFIRKHYKINFLLSIWLFFLLHLKITSASVVPEHVKTEGSTMADQLDQLLSVTSDFQLYQDMFGSFELFMPDMSDDESAQDPGPDINKLLKLPTAEIISSGSLDPGEISDPIPLTDTTDPVVDNPLPCMPKQEETDQQLSVSNRNEHVSEIVKLERRQNGSVKAETQQTTSRFKRLTATELDDIKENKYALKTKSNTKWGVNLFQG